MNVYICISNLIYQSFTSGRKSQQKWVFTTPSENDLGFFLIKCESKPGKTLGLIYAVFYYSLYNKIYLGQ